MSAAFTPGQELIERSGRLGRALGSVIANYRDGRIQECAEALGEVVDVVREAEEVTTTEARLLEAHGPLEMARLIEALSDELAWIEVFATVRSQDDSKTFARVNRGALRTIAARARKARGETP